MLVYEHNLIFIIKTWLIHVFLSSPVSKNLFDPDENDIATRVQSLFNDDLIFFHSLIISGLLIKTTMSA